MPILVHLLEVDVVRHTGTFFYLDILEALPLLGMRPIASILDY